MIRKTNLFVSLQWFCFINLASKILNFDVLLPLKESSADGFSESCLLNPRMSGARQSIRVSILSEMFKSH